MLPLELGIQDFTIEINKDQTFSDLFNFILVRHQEKIENLNFSTWKVEDRSLGFVRYCLESKLEEVLRDIHQSSFQIYTSKEIISKFYSLAILNTQQSESPKKIEIQQQVNNNLIKLYLKENNILVDTIDLSVNIFINDLVSIIQGMFDKNYQIYYGQNNLQLMNQKVKLNEIGMKNQEVLNLIEVQNLQLNRNQKNNLSKDSEEEIDIIFQISDSQKATKAIFKHKFKLSATLGEASNAIYQYLQKSKEQVDFQFFINEKIVPVDLTFQQLKIVPNQEIEVKERWYGGYIKK